MKNLKEMTMAKSEVMRTFDNLRPSGLGYHAAIAMVLDFSGSCEPLKERQLEVFENTVKFSIDKGPKTWLILMVIYGAEAGENACSGCRVIYSGYMDSFPLEDFLGTAMQTKCTGLSPIAEAVEEATGYLEALEQYFDEHRFVHTCNTLMVLSDYFPEYGRNYRPDLKESVGSIRRKVEQQELLLLEFTITKLAKELSFGGYTINYGHDGSEDAIKKCHLKIEAIVKALIIASQTRKVENRHIADDDEVRTLTPKALSASYRRAMLNKFEDTYQHTSLFSEV